MIRELQKVLLAEDEPDIREVASMSLEMLGGLTLEVCESGVDVVDKALSFKPDIVVLDVMMPNMDGPSALAALRATPGCEAIPVVFMTAKVMQEEVDELWRLGASDVIAKPFDPVTLPSRLQELWLKINESIDDK